MDKLWKDVLGYEGYYQISNYGEVKSLIRKNRPTERILTVRINKRNYCSVGLTKNHTTKMKPIHRLVGYAFLNLTDNMEMNHKDLNKTNNTVTNLEVVTPSENKRRAYLHGHGGRTTRFTVQDVLNIKKLLHKKIQVKTIAKLYQCWPSTISNINTGRRWGWL